MAFLSSLVSANTFLQWRGNMNEIVARFNDFASHSTRLYGNTITANTSFAVNGVTKNLLVANGVSGNVGIGVSTISPGFQVEMTGQMKCVPTSILTIANSAGSVVKTVNGVGA